MIPLTCLLALSLSPSHSLHFAWGQKTVICTGDQEEICCFGASVKRLCVGLCLGKWTLNVLTETFAPTHRGRIISFWSVDFLDLGGVKGRNKETNHECGRKGHKERSFYFKPSKKKKNHKHLDFLFKKNKTNKQKELCPCVVHLGAYLLFIYCNDGSPHPRRRGALMRTQYQERSQRSARSPARPEASWHAHASLRTHALSRVIPHLVTICHCHP